MMFERKSLGLNVDLYICSPFFFLHHHHHLLVVFFLVFFFFILLFLLSEYNFRFQHECMKKRNEFCCCFVSILLETEFLLMTILLTPIHFDTTIHYVNEKKKILKQLNVMRDDWKEQQQQNQKERKNSLIGNACK